MLLEVFLSVTSIFDQLVFVLAYIVTYMHDSLR